MAITGRPLSPPEEVDDFACARRRWKAPIVITQGHQTKVRARIAE